MKYDRTLSRETSTFYIDILETATSTQPLIYAIAWNVCDTDVAKLHQNTLFMRSLIFIRQGDIINPVQCIFFILINVSVE